jgi:hypothetical protein
MENTNTRVLDIISRQDEHTTRVSLTNGKHLLVKTKRPIPMSSTLNWVNLTLSELSLIINFHNKYCFYN